MDQEVGRGMGCGFLCKMEMVHGGMKSTGERWRHRSGVVQSGVREGARLQGAGQRAGEGMAVDHGGVQEEARWRAGRKHVLSFFSLLHCLLFSLPSLSLRSTLGQAKGWVRVVAHQ